MNGKSELANSTRQISDVLILQTILQKLEVYEMTLSLIRTAQSLNIYFVQRLSEYLASPPFIQRLEK